MEIHVAPLEGLTYPEYRLVHSRMFPGVDKYYAPFIAPGAGKINRSFLSRRLPDSENEVNTVPQLLANSGEKFVTCAVMLRDLGFNEINLNAGCPSATVFSKHKGAGMLSDLESLDAFLNTVFSSRQLGGMNISVKTRMGVGSPGEFEKILEVYNRYPISCLTVHARDRAGFYKSRPAVEEFIRCLPKSVNPMSYNGNIFSAADLSDLQEKLPSLNTVMVGRGVVANPSLVRMLKGGESLKLEELRNFHGALVDAYLSSGLDSYNVTQRMKELWYYMISLFGDCEREKKRIFKSKSYDEYLLAVGELMHNCPFDGAAPFHNSVQNA